MNRILIFAAVALLMPLSALAEDSFLEAHEVALLKPAANVPGLENYTADGKDPAKYSKVVLGSITFFYADDSKTKDMDAKESTQITDALKGVMTDNLKKYLEIVDQPGPDTLLLNMAVTQIKMKNKKRGLLGYTPIGLVVTTAGNLSGSRLVLDKAAMQGEMLDSQSGDIVTLFQVSQIEQLDDKKQLTWEDVRLTLNDLANRALKDRFGG
jgi:hypothetical protein